MPQINISIPEPCSEQWGAMTPVEQGRFCGSCNKDVVDLTQKEPNEILELYRKAEGKMCGRFREDQLVPASPIQPIGWMKRFLLAMVLAFGAHLFVFAQVETESAVHTAREQLLRAMHPERVLTYTVTVRDGETREPVAGAKAMVVGAKGEVKWTDEFGIAMLTVDRNEIWRLPLVIRINTQQHHQQDIVVTDVTSDWLVHLVLVDEDGIQAPNQKKPQKVQFTNVDFRLVDPVAKRNAGEAFVVKCYPAVAASNCFPLPAVGDKLYFSEASQRDDLESGYVWIDEPNSKANSSSDAETKASDIHLKGGFKVATNTDTLNPITTEVPEVLMGEVWVSEETMVNGQVQISDSTQTAPAQELPLLVPANCTIGKPRIVPVESQQ